jgi:copper chaperone
MTTKTYIVPAISCSHCTHTIERELGFVEGVENVQAEENTKKVTVEVNDAAVLAEVEATLADIGYPPAQMMQIE